MLNTNEALLFTIAMGVVIFFCRVFPFLFFRGSEEVIGKSRTAFLRFVEKVVPPVAMTVLTFNALSSPLTEDIHNGIPIIIAAVFTATIHILKRNTLLSISGGTILYMTLNHFL